MAATATARTVVLGHAVAVQLDPTAPVEAVGFIAVREHALDLDCTCGRRSGDGVPACPHAWAAAERLYREGVARVTSSAHHPRRFVAV